MMVNEVEATRPFKEQYQPRRGQQDYLMIKASRRKNHLCNDLQIIARLREKQDGNTSLPNFTNLLDDLVQETEQNIATIE